MTSRCPRVSVGVPVYNGERYLAETLDSLLAQTFEDFEIIICDNASTDGTAEVARAFAARDARVRYHRSPVNAGAAANYRRSFELARGHYFRWSAADDLSAPSLLARCVEVLDDEPAAVLAYARTRFIDEQGRVTGDYDDNLHLQSPQPSVRFRQVLERLSRCNSLYGLMRVDVLKQTRLPGNFVGADIVFAAELSLYGTFWELPEFLFYRRFHPSASSSMTRAQLLAFYRPQSPSLWLREWRHLGEHLRSVSHSPLSLAPRLRTLAFLVRYGIGNRRNLAGELLSIVRHGLSELSGYAIPPDTTPAPAKPDGGSI
jgi:glycosyltransferase involved in cell wall biosynthesis